MKKVLFVDRDGTILIEPADQQIDSLEKVAFVEGAIPALRLLADTGWVLVLVSNQDGLGTRSFPREAFEGPQNLMLQILGSAGISFQDIFICPHFADDKCLCRKPGTELLLPYIREGFDRNRSAVIGDRQSDEQLGTALGIRSFRLSQDLAWSEIARTLIEGSRSATRRRRSRETEIRISLDLDRFEKPRISSGHPFFNHMLEQIAYHAGIFLSIVVEGDWQVDDHHSIEDTAILLGETLREALGDMHGVGRYGFVLPMDECLAQCALDLSGRPYCHYAAVFTREKVGELSTEMIGHFFSSLADGLRATLHMEIKGSNNHHLVESGFKAFGRCLGQAIAARKGDSIPSSKGML